MRFNFYNVKGEVCLSFSFILGAILLMLFSITGCSETPLGSSMLTLDDIDRYTISKDGDVICIRDALDSACMTLFPEDRNLIGVGKAPIIYIYPEKLTYIFYREDEPILRAERLIDTTDILQGLRGTEAGGNGASKQNNNGRNGNDNNGDEGTPGINNPQETHPPRNTNPSEATDGWIITIYYPDRSHLPTKLAHSGLTIKINEKQIEDGDIKDFSIFTNSESEQGIRFVYPVGSAEFSGLKIEISGLANTQEIVRFDLEPPVETP